MYNLLISLTNYLPCFIICSLSLQIGRTHDKTNVIICISVFIISIDLYVDNSYVFMKQKISIIYVDIFIHIYRERHIHRDFFPEPLEINLYTSLKKNPKYINVYFLKLKIRFSGKESSCQCRRCRRWGFNLWVGKIPRSMKWQLTLIYLPEKFHRQRSLMGYSPWGSRESHTHHWVTEHAQSLTKLQSQDSYQRQEVSTDQIFHVIYRSPVFQGTSQWSLPLSLCLRQGASGEDLVLCLVALSL